MNTDAAGEYAALYGAGPDTILVLPPSFTYMAQAVQVVRAVPSVYDAHVTLDGTRLFSAHRNAFRVLMEELSALDAYDITLEAREPWALDMFKREAGVFGPLGTYTRLVH
jgi:hypothetical protein